jgi:D-glycero-D-manno-heptose 1,7-bisphosphate phosphatase
MRAIAPGAARGAIFFDRDGVLNVDSGFVHRAEDFRWIDGARDAVRLVNDAGLHVIVVTNQSGVARGYYGEEDVRKLHEWMRRDLAGHGAHIDAFYYCPYLDEATVEAYRFVDHPDRKPNPGLILRALSDFSVDPRRAVLIGDKASDLEAASRAGVGAIGERSRQSSPKRSPGGPRSGLGLTPSKAMATGKNRPNPLTHPSSAPR